MKPCLCMNVPYGHSFHTGKDGHVYTRLRPSSDYPCAGNAIAAVPALIDDCILIKHELTRIYVENTSLEELPRGIFLMSRLKEVLTPCADIYLNLKEK